VTGLRALTVATDALHCAVDIFISRVLISKDGPKRSQGSVTGRELRRKPY
jgi:hypothetical protein